MSVNHIQSEYYSNYLMVSQDGKPLNTVDKRRCDWYLKRNLAEEIDWPDKQYPKVIRLKFKHKGNTNKRESDTMLVESRCVVCGSTKELSLHHVVPHSIKKHYPEKKKNYTRYLCVLLCEKHHQEIEQVNRGIKGPDFSLIHKHICFINRIISYYQLFLRKFVIKKWLFQIGGIEKANKVFIDKFLEMKPKYLPKGWL
jgi:hypothetical protein